MPTGPKNNNVAIFGNDYLITCDNNNAITSRKMLHRNIITLAFGKEANEGKQV